MGRYSTRWWRVAHGCAHVTENDVSLRPRQGVRPVDARTLAPLESEIEGAAMTLHLVLVGGSGEQPRQRRHVCAAVTGHIERLGVPRAAVS